MKIVLFGREITIAVKKLPKVTWKHYAFIGQSNKLKMFIDGKHKRKFDDFTIDFHAGIRGDCYEVKKLLARKRAESERNNKVS